MVTPQVPAIPDDPLGPGDDLALFDRYPVAVRKLRGGVRVDVIVAEASPTPAIEAPDFVARMRWFFAEMDAEIDRHVNDPIATAQALARVEALLADVRYVRDRLHQVTAEGLRAMAIRRLTVTEVTTVEASNTYERTAWQHAALLTAMLRWWDIRVIDVATGEYVPADQVAEVMLNWFRPDWKLTAIRDADLDPDDYCTVARDDDGKPMKTPTVRIVDNRVRRQR